MHNANVNKRLLWGLYVAWGIPVATFLTHPSYDPQTWPVWLAMGVTLSICLADRRFCALALPFVAMFSPLAGASGVMNLLPSEIFLAYCGLSWFRNAFAGKNQVKLLPGDAYLLLLALIALISYIQSFEYAALLPSFLNWIALIIVFAVTRANVRSIDLVRIYFLTLLVVAGYASTLIVTSFFNELALAYFWSDVEKIPFSSRSPEYFFRASYFYTNVTYVLGAAAIGAIVSAFSNDKPIYKLFSSGLLIAILATLFIMFRKSALFALAGCLPVLLLIVFASEKSHHPHSGMSQYILGIGLCIFLLFFGAMVVETLNLTGGTASFGLRLDVISSSIQVLLQAPEHVFFGFGPDASTRLSNEAVNLARQSGAGTEGAIDSTYMTFLFEYGFCFLVLFLVFGAHTLLRLFRLIRRNHQARSVPIILFGTIVFFYIDGGTEVMGTSKVAWVIVQVFALAGICLREKYQIDGNTVAT
jgi:hypothetical protein